MDVRSLLDLKVHYGTNELKTEAVEVNQKMSLTAKNKIQKSFS
jgi:hypothetical protein